MRARRWWFVFSCVGLSSACGNAPTGESTPQVPYTPPSSNPDGGGTPSNPLDAGSQPASSRRLPCDVATVVDQHCSLCHGATPSAGAPMSLQTYDDFHANSVISGTPIVQLADQRIHAASSPMPPTSQDRLTAAELTTLGQWLEQGAPAYDGTCQASPPEFTPPDAATPDAGSDGTGIVYDPIQPGDCEQSIELRAFDPNNPSQPFPVGISSNSYECFVFQVPYSEKMQALQVESIIDNAAVVHHWLLYNQAGAASGNSYYNCAGQHPAAQLLAGWAPGRGDTEMPRGVGLQLPEKSSGSFVLEIHYNNSTNAAGLRDKSGARVCATSKLKPNEAAVHWLGRESLVIPPGKVSLTGTCTAPKQSTVLSMWPHMHKLGSHMKVELTRSGGTPSVVLDKDFSFDDQRSYDEPMLLSPGDKLATTCTWDNTTINIVGFGTASEAEMCYNFVLAYPAGSLASGFSLTGTNSTCIDPL